MSKYHSSGGWLSTHVKLPLNKICVCDSTEGGKVLSGSLASTREYHQVLKGHNTFTYHLVNKIKIEHYTRNRFPIDLESWRVFFLIFNHIYSSYEVNNPGIRMFACCV